MASEATGAAFPARAAVLGITAAFSCRFLYFRKDSC